MATTATDFAEPTFMFRGLSDESDKDPDDLEIGGGFGDVDDGKPKPARDDDGLPEEEPVDDGAGEEDDLGSGEAEM